MIMRNIAPGDCDLYRSRTSASNSSVYVMLESEVKGVMPLQIRIHSDFHSLERYQAVYPNARNRFTRLKYDLSQCV